MNDLQNGNNSNVQAEQHHDICGYCGGARGQHEHGACVCKHAIVRAYWEPIEALPPYMGTRENVTAWEAAAPEPCHCHTFVEELEKN